MVGTWGQEEDIRIRRASGIGRCNICIDRDASGEDGMAWWRGVCLLGIRYVGPDRVDL